MAAATLADLQRRPVRLSKTGEPATGELRLVVARQGQRSVVKEAFHQGALSVMRTHRLDNSGQAAVVMVNPGGGYLDNDRYQIDLEVQAEASLLLTSQSATKVYRTPTAPVQQQMLVQLGENAVLELLPEQLIVYEDGAYQQNCIVQMHPRATFIYGEVVTPGWSPSGNKFSYRQIALRTEVQLTHDAQPQKDEASKSVEPKIALLDNLLLSPTDSAIDQLGMLDNYSHLGSLIIVDRRVDAQLVDDAVAICLTRAAKIQAGVTMAPGPSLIMRALGNQTSELSELIFDLDALVRERWLGQERINLRKY